MTEQEYLELNRQQMLRDAEAQSRRSDRNRKKRTLIAIVLFGLSVAGLVAGLFL